MNSLRKTFLILSLVAVVPATVQALPSWLSWSNMKQKGTELRSYLGRKAPEAVEVVSKFARNNPKKTVAGVVATAAVIGGAGYLAKKYGAVSKARNAAGKVVSAPQSLTVAAYNRFAALPRPKKAGVVIGGAIAVAGAAYLAKLAWDKYKNPTAAITI